MSRKSIFALRVNPYEKLLIAKLATHLKRSRSDAIRYLILNAAQELLNKQFSAEGERGINKILIDYQLDLLAKLYARILASPNRDEDKPTDCEGV